MRYSDSRIVFQEIPVEISLAFFITGCPLRCKGCHSTAYWNGQLGELLTPKLFEHKLNVYKNYISCVLFLGGEWEDVTLASFLIRAGELGLKTALYTGLEKKEVPQSLIPYLDYLKYGPYDAQRGGLNSSATNQKLIYLKDNTLLNHHFL